MRRLVLATPVACLLGVCLLSLGCDRGGGEAAVVRGALGQPAGDFPNYDERVTLYATNRARADPAAEGWPAYPAQPPLQWNVDLNRSARAHSQDMHDTPCFQHNSCDGTDAFVRVQSYYTARWTAIGENISAGKSVSDGFIALHNWLFEIGAAPGETGHRDNIFSAKFTLLGNGFVPGGTAFQNYWTQDFIGTSVTRPRLTDGVHFPGSVAAGGGVSFGTTYYDAGGAAPTDIAVVVDGTSNPLALVRGAAARGAYETKLSLAAGCHPYFFLSTTGGVDVTYPDSGALQVAVGVAASACPLAVATRAGGGGSGGVDGSGGAAGTTDPGAGGAGGAGGDNGTGGDSGDGDGGVAPIPPPADRGGPLSGKFGCAVGPAPPAAGDGPLLAFLIGLAACAGQRRRRR